MNLYYINYPRDFANEYTVYVVTPELRERFKKAFPDADRITRKSAIERGWSRVKEAHETGEQWFGGFANLNGSGFNVSETIAGAIAATEFAVKEQEDYVTC